MEMTYVHHRFYAQPPQAFVNELQEQELRKGDFHRIFPVRETAANYLPFFTCADMRDELKKIIPLLPATAGDTSSVTTAPTPIATAAVGATADK